LLSVNQKQPLVSIITPTYNHEAFIGSCIESVLAQSYTDWEQIIVDDGSTDGTEEVVRGFRDPRIRYVRQENVGIQALAQTYNHGLRLSQGSIIAILEGDDTWPADKLATMLTAFEEPDVVLAFGNAEDLDENGALARRKSRTEKQRARLPRSVFFNDPVRSATAHLLSHSGQTFIPPSTVVIRRDALEAISGFQQACGPCPVDVPTFVRLSFIGKFHYLPKVLGYRRRHLSSATCQFLEPMTKAGRAFALSVAADPLIGLTRVERESVEDSWRSGPFIAEFWLGRICLVNRQATEARSHFAAAMGARDLRVVLSSVMGWALSWLHSDMEGVARLMGRYTLTDGRS
jgi:glycosyltransferase involved in cell wall biosynthesis